MILRVFYTVQLTRIIFRLLLVTICLPERKDFFLLILFNVFNLPNVLFKFFSILSILNATQNNLYHTSYITMRHLYSHPFTKHKKVKYLKKSQNFIKIFPNSRPVKLTMLLSETQCWNKNQLQCLFFWNLLQNLTWLSLNFK